MGGAFVSPVHANFLVAGRGATAQDVFELVAIIQQEVERRFGVELELEVQTWGHQLAPA